MQLIQSRKIFQILMLIVSVAGLGACGGGEDGADGGDVNAEEMVPALAPVAARYANNGANWNDYVLGQDIDPAFGDSPLLDEPCVAGERCSHGGERRTVMVDGVTACTGLTATDALNAFGWVCVNDATNNGVSMVSTGLADGKHLSDLIDFDNPGFLPNSVTVYFNGTALGKTPATSWWDNYIETVFPTAENAPVILPLIAAPDGVIYLISDTAKNGSFSLVGDKVGLVVKPGMTLQGFRGNENWIDEDDEENKPKTAYDQVIEVLGSYSWFEGAVTGVKYLVGVSCCRGSHNTLRNVNVSATTAIDINAFENQCFDENGAPVVTVGEADYIGTGMELGGANNRFEYLSASRNEFTGIGLSGTDNFLSHIEVFSNGNARPFYVCKNLEEPGPGLVLRGAKNNVINDVNAEGNSVGITVAFSDSNQFKGSINSSYNNTGIDLSLSNDNSFNGEPGAFVVSNNTESGVAIVDSLRTKIANLTASSNDNGIYILASADGSFDDLFLDNNTLNGLFLIDCKENLRDNCSQGISENNEFTALSLAGNGQFAIRLEADNNRFLGPNTADPAACYTGPRLHESRFSSNLDLANPGIDESCVPAI